MCDACWSGLSLAVRPPRRRLLAGQAQVVPRAASSGARRADRKAVDIELRQKCCGANVRKLND